jgi:hypothetical protein
MRVKLQVFSEAQQRWKTVYVLYERIVENTMLLRAYGLKWRICS